MGSRRAEAAPAGSDSMRSGLSLRLIAGLVLASFAAHAAAQDTVRVTTDTDLDGDHVDASGDVVAPDPPPDPGWALERFATRFGVFQQDGAPGGFQSQAGPTDRHRPGSEQTWIFQPILFARIRQDARIHHEVYIPVDVVSAASTDALDVVSSASRENEAVSLDIYSTVEADADTRYTLHWGGHVEEPLRSATLGYAVSRDLADDNAVVSVSFDGIVDFADQVQFTGYDPGMTTRFTGTVNASLSQLLSPTTIAAVSYGLTGQTGLLQTPWNSVPIEGGDRVGDLFPHTRLRHAFVGRLAQAIPDSRTFIAAQYRLYVDDFGVIAHTPEASVTQYLGDDFSLRVSYRFHTQNAARFWTSLLPAGFDLDRPHTADSDLAALDAQEVGGVLRWYYDHSGALTSRSNYLEASYYHYERTNGLYVNLISLGWGITL
jgi:hypothetical protein